MSQSVMITGANRGIGRAIALKLAELGYDLFLLGRDEETLSAVATDCRARNVKAEYLVGQLGDESYMDSAIQTAKRTYGAIDVLVNNAGFAVQQEVQNADLAVWHDLMDINFNSIMYLSRHILPGMIEKKAGAVINISSLSGRNTSSGYAIYCASKHALNGFSECMFEDVRDAGIKVSTIMPGFVDTGLTESLDLQKNKMITPEDVAESVQYVLSASPNCCPTEIVLRPQLRP